MRITIEIDNNDGEFLEREEAILAALTGTKATTITVETPAAPKPTPAKKAAAPKPEPKAEPVEEKQPEPEPEAEEDDMLGGEEPMTIAKALEVIRSEFIAKNNAEPVREALRKRGVKKVGDLPDSEAASLLAELGVA